MLNSVFEFKFVRDRKGDCHLFLIFALVFVSLFLLADKSSAGVCGDCYYVYECRTGTESWRAGCGTDVWRELRCPYCCSWETRTGQHCTGSGETLTCTTYTYQVCVACCTHFYGWTLFKDCPYWAKCPSDGSQDCVCAGECLETPENPKIILEDDTIITPKIVAFSSSPFALENPEIASANFSPMKENLFSGAGFQYLNQILNYFEQIKTQVIQAHNSSGKSSSNIETNSNFSEAILNAFNKSFSFLVKKIWGDILNILISAKNLAGHFTVQESIEIKAATLFSNENLSRALIALPQDSGRVYLGWRFFKTDDPSTTFNIYRKPESGNYVKIATVTDSTNYLDSSTVSGNTYYYIVKPVLNSVEGTASNEARVTTGSRRDYISIPLSSNRGAARVIAGDLDGDGILDYVAMTPSEANAGETYHLEAYLSTGSLLWNFDLGIGNEMEGNVWTHSYTVWDLDGDKKAEVLARIKRSGNYYLAKINGLTGSIERQVSWPSLVEYGDWRTNSNDRHIMAIAYLDGNNPYIVIQVGTYPSVYTSEGAPAYGTKGRVKLQAFDKNLSLLWAREGLGDGAAGHGIRIIDYDNDGKDEIVQGSNLVDENGNLVWTAKDTSNPYPAYPYYWDLGLGHVDKMIPGNIDPDNPGYEIFYTQEPYGSEVDPHRAGSYLVSMNNGSILWGKTGYIHLHSDEWAADVTKNYPGWELWMHERTHEGPVVGSYLFSSKGQLISSDWLYNRPPIWWDDDDVWELIRDSGDGYWYIMKYPDQVVFQTDGILGNPGDFIGDYRDDYLIVKNNEIRIYANTNVSYKKLPTPLQDRYYRISLSMQATGYYHNAQLLDPDAYFGSVPEPSPSPSPPPPLVCAIDSAEITADCSGDGDETCTAGERIKVKITYGGSDCPAPAYIQIDAASSDGVCKIQASLGDITGIQPTPACSSSPCDNVYWTIPSVPNDCLGKDVFAKAVSIWKDGFSGTGTLIAGRSAVGDENFGAFTFVLAPLPTCPALGGTICSAPTPNCNGNLLYSSDANCCDCSGGSPCCLASATPPPAPPPGGGLPNLLLNQTNQWQLIWDNVYSWGREFGPQSYRSVTEMKSSPITQTIVNSFTKIVPKDSGTFTDPNAGFTPQTCELKSNAYHYWKVQTCCNADGTNCGPQSDWQYTTRTPPELICSGAASGPPEVVSVCIKDPDGPGPLEADFIIPPGETFHFDWCDVPGAKSYDLRAHIDDISEGKELIYTTDTDAEGRQYSLYNVPLLADAIGENPAESWIDDDLGNIVRKTHYNWKVATCLKTSGIKCDNICGETVDAKVCADWSKVWNFIGHTELTAPELVAPPYGSFVNVENVLQWRNPRGAFAYTVYIRKPTGFTELMLPTTTDIIYPLKSFWKLISGQSTLTLNQEYLWKVKACWNPKGTLCDRELWSGERSFVTTGKPPTFDESDSGPFDGSLVAIPTRLNWDDMPGAASYRYQVATDNMFSDIVSEGKTGVSEVVLDYPALKMEEMYYWRAKTCADTKATICGDYFSPKRTFITGRIPPPTLKSPEDGKEIWMPFFLKWNTISGGELAKKYQYRRFIKIKNPLDSSLTDYPVMLSLNTVFLIDQNKMQADCDDIRFIDTDGTLLDYWLKPGTCNTVSTEIWVKIPYMLPAIDETHPSEKQIDMYYGNPSAASASDAAVTPISDGIQPYYSGWGIEESLAESGFKFSGWEGEWYRYYLASTDGSTVKEGPAPCCEVFFAGLDLETKKDYKWRVRSCLEKAETSAEIDERCGGWSPEWGFALIEPQPPAWGGFVPCGRLADDPNTTSYKETEPCQIYHLFLMFQNILNFLLWRAGPLLLVILGMATGALYYFSFGAPGPAMTAKAMLKAAGIGYLIILFSWMLITFVLRMFGIATEWWIIKF